MSVQNRPYGLKVLRVWKLKHQNWRESRRVRFRSCCVRSPCGIHRYVRRQRSRTRRPARTSRDIGVRAAPF